MSPPDEGLIHAWLDGELDAAGAARVEALVKNDPDWAAAAAEARGFIAASARILGALDDVPANVVPRAGATNLKAPANPAGAVSGSAEVRPIASVRLAKRGAPWWAIRAAAVLVIVAGTAVVLTRGGVPGVDTGAPAAAVQTPSAQPPAAALAETEKTQEPAAAASRAGNAPVGAPLQTKAAAPGAPATANASAGGKAAAVSSLDKTSLAETDVARRKDAAVMKGTAASAAPAAPAVSAPTAPAPTRAQTTLPSAKALADERVAATGAVAPPAAKATNEVATRRAAPTPAAAGAGAAPSLRQAAAPTAAAASALGAPGAPATTGAAANLPIACYREVTTAPGDVAIVHRVVRTSDSTAVPALPADASRDAPGFRAEAQAIRPAPLAVRNDTLVLGVVDGRVRYAIRVSCPQP